MTNAFWLVYQFEKKREEESFFKKITAYEGGGFSVDKFNYNGA